MKKNEKGITLIALVITIIILLILAGITLATLTGDNGLFSRSKEAKEKYKIEDYREQIELVKEAVIIENMGEIELNKLKEEIKNSDRLSDSDVSNIDEETLQIVTKEGYTYIVTKGGEINYIEKGKREAIEIIDDFNENVLDTNIWDVYGGTGSMSFSDSKIYLSSAANQSIGISSKYLMDGTEKNVEVEMTVESEGGTYRESRYTMLGKVQIIPSTYHTNQGIMYSNKGVMNKIPFVSIPYTIKFKFISQENKVQIYINEALKGTVEDVDISKLIGKPIYRVDCSSWTNCSCSVNKISMKIEY